MPARAGAASAIDRSITRTEKAQGCAPRLDCEPDRNAAKPNSGNRVEATFTKSEQRLLGPDPFEVGVEGFGNLPFGYFALDRLDDL